jgi:exopolysaccharide biosynthesis polyprenyl glycosylphosphotransferase
MTSFRRRLLLNCLQFFDLMVITASFALATAAVYYETGGISLVEFLEMRAKVQNFGFFLLFLVGGHIAFSAFGIYQSQRLSACGSEIRDILKATALGSGALWIAALAFNLELLTPLFLTAFFVATSLLMISSRLALRWMLARLRVHGRNLRNMLIVGTNSRAVRFAKDIEARPELGYRIVGFVDNEWSGTGEFRQNGYELVANFTNFKHYISHNVVDEVVIQLPLKSLYQTASEIVSACEQQGLIVRYLPDVFDRRLARPAAEQLVEDPVVTLHAGAKDSWSLLAKRLMDIAISSGAIIILSPLFLAVAFLIKFTSPGPVFFVQDRIGLNKRCFLLYKFRTMMFNAEKMQAELEAINEMTGPVFKITNDPRITKIGRFLRRSSIDELPQLFNVLKGDMSLVGPRPLPMRDYNGFDQDWQRRRFSIRPGITCLWQVNGRNKVTFSRWMELDMQYIDHWSFLLDLKILAQTIPAVLKGTGAI